MYKKAIPKFLTPFASEKGKMLFKQSLLEGNMQNYFELSEQYLTQARPEDCAISSLVMILNSLGIDPGKKWKGPWRWYSEDLLHCLDPEKNGLSLHEFLRLAHCNKSWAIGFYSNTLPSISSEDYTCNQHQTRLYYRSCSIQTFRAAILAASRQSKFYMAANYSRKALLQSGDGHYSPIAGYNSAHDMCLILDVARFKYPAYWLPVPLAFKSLELLDPETQNPRGFVCVSRSASHFSPICSRQADYVSLKKLPCQVSLPLLSQGHQELHPVIFRFFCDLYEDFSPDFLSSLAQTLPDHPVHPEIQSLCDELNPTMPSHHSQRLLTATISSKYVPVLAKYRESFGLL